MYNFIFSFVKSSYSDFLASGFMDLAEIDDYLNMYPSFENLKQNFNDKPHRVKWRSKQVVDYAVMADIARKLGKYCIYIEDDVVSSTEIYKDIMDGVQRFSDQNWTIIEFSPLGFIGKLFKAEDLEVFSKFLLLFFDERAVDNMHNLFRKLQGQDQQITYKPSLFQHFGRFSSFAHKTRRKLNHAVDVHFNDMDPIDKEAIDKLRKEIKRDG